MKDQLIIRADATEIIGFGHVMRCLSFALVWLEKMGDVILISHCSFESLNDKIKRMGIKFIQLNGSIPNTQDIEITHSIISKNPAKWVMLDGYHFTSNYHLQIKKTGRNLLVMDDYNHLPDYYADILVNQNINAERINYNCPDQTLKLLGSKYVFLREEFINIPRKKKCQKRVKNVLITMGGSDSENVSSLVLKSFQHISVSGLNIRVIVGPGFRFINELRKSAVGLSGTIEFVNCPPKMSEHMLWADLAISAAGSTCWELAYIGVPSLILVVAENQEMNANAFSERDSFYNLGWYNKLTEKTIARKINQVIADIVFRQEMVNNQQKLVDGRGAHRIVNEISEFMGSSG